MKVKKIIVTISLIIIGLILIYYCFFITYSHWIKNVSKDYNIHKGDCYIYDDYIVEIPSYLAVYMEEYNGWTYNYKKIYYFNDKIDITILSKQNEIKENASGIESIFINAKDWVGTDVKEILNYAIKEKEYRLKYRKIGIIPIYSF